VIGLLSLKAIKSNSSVRLSLISPTSQKHYVFHTGKGIFIIITLLCDKHFIGGYLPHNFFIGSFFDTYPVKSNWVQLYEACRYPLHIICIELIHWIRIGQGLVPRKPDNFILGINVNYPIKKIS